MISLISENITLIHMSANSNNHYIFFRKLAFNWYWIFNINYAFVYFYNVTFTWIWCTLFILSISFDSYCKSVILFGLFNYNLNIFMIGSYGVRFTKINWFTTQHASRALLWITQDENLSKNYEVTNLDIFNYKGKFLSPGGGFGGQIWMLEATKMAMLNGKGTEKEG